MSSASDAQPTYADTGRVALIALFVTALVTSQLISAKVLGFSLPVELPIIGAMLVFPGGTFAYAATYFASDCVSELYGKKFARTVVNVGFFMNFVMLALVWITIVSPPGPTVAPEFADNFATVLSSGTNIVLGSLFAYVISQNWDVLAFHRIRERTGPAHLWLRNIGSTATSQFLDTVVFTIIAFWAAPIVLGTGQPRPQAVIVSIVVGQYFAKLLIALVDTPFVYAAVSLLRSQGEDSFAGTLAD